MFLLSVVVNILLCNFYDILSVFLRQAMPYALGSEWFLGCCCSISKM